MKVVFLDFDGVLNSQGSFLYEDNRRSKHGEQGVKGPVPETLCNVCTANFQMILDQYKEVKIVLSTTWRLLYSIDWLKAKLESYHIDSSRVIDKTPSRYGDERGLEIQDWLDTHPEVTHYIVIDDNDWNISALHGDRFVKTTWEAGLTFDKAQEACEKLSNHHKNKIMAALAEESKSK